MIDDKIQINTNERPPHPEQLSWQTQAEQSSRQILQTQASAPNAAPQPEQRVAPGRRPLFRS
jgi:hypothetical protein